jgi:hypothetical protein
MMMRGLRLASLILLASAGIALTQQQPPPASKPLDQPCGPPVYDNDFFFVDKTGASRQFCVRERHFVRPDGGYRARAAVDGSLYCTDDNKLFETVTNCNFLGTVRCNRKSKQFLITFRFMSCQGVFGRKNFTRKNEPLTAVLTPPGLSSPAGAFLAP